MVRSPTHCELLRTVVDLMKDNKADWAVFGATIDRLEKRVNCLEQENQRSRSRLDKDSENSSKPPSSDSFRKPTSPPAGTGRFANPLVNRRETGWQQRCFVADDGDPRPCPS